MPARRHSQTPLPARLLPHISMLTVIAGLALLGLVTGFLAGLLGIGGGMMMVPFISTLLGARGVAPELAIKMAIATSMATIVFTSLSSVRAHHKKGAVRWRLVGLLAPGIVLGAMAASFGVFAAIKGTVLTLVFALFVFFSATQMLLGKKPAATRQLPGRAGLLGAGGAIGFLSGLVGAGGGFISVPFLTWCNVPIHAAVATSAGLGFPIALANVTGYIVSGLKAAGPLPPHSLGYVWLPGLAAIACCSVLMAPVGAKAAHRLPVDKLKRAFAGILYLLGAYMLYRGLRQF
jgi:uncharacterized membrane protein YfcA